MDRITFSVNGNKCSVGHEVDSDVSLNDYIRNWLHLPGTKYMCKEGGCGTCIVSVTAPAPDGSLRTFSVNSCLVSVTSCQDWQVKTIEGLGSRQGYHPVQRALADHNGTQCGYCSPGWVMSMYSLLESNHYDLTQYEIENAFGSNTCRCTGYRPILDAFKGFAKDAPKPKAEIYDIEDLEACKNHGKCNKTCQSWCFVAKKESNPVVKKINLKDNRVWYRVNEVKDIFDIFSVEGTDFYMLVNGNTGRGAVPIFEFPRVLIDIQPVDQLKMHYIDQNLVLGAGIVLNDVMRIFKSLSETKEEFSYLIKLYEHLDLVAHIPVRNIGSIGGNLMVKHRLPTFSSDIFLLLESVGATLTIISATDTIEVTPEQFLTVDMTGRLITNIKLPPLSKNYEFVSFKIMPRSQNAHASVNAAFLYHFNSYHHGMVLSARIVYGGLSATFVHAKLTEEFLVNKKLFTNEVLQGALKILDQELIVEEIPAEFKPEYRKKTALGLFYKGLLNLKPQAAKPFYRSGGRDMRKTRPLSKGTEVYDTNPIIWPINEPMPKVEALIQCSGEAKYINDDPPEAKEVYCAFVTSDICVGEIESIDPSPAMELPGVLAFFTAKDIPGVNSFISSKVDFFSPEVLLSDGKINYYDQPIAIIVAETEKLANKAALLVNVKYKVDPKKPILTIKDVRERDPNRITTFIEVPARDRGNNVQKVIQDCKNIFWQYHYTMETQTSLSRPSDDGIEVKSATQWLDLTHLGISELLKLEQSRIDLSVTRCGGGYGVKITRATMVAVACSLVTHLLNRPCRFVMSMQANMRVIGKRFPATLDYEVGVSDEGEIQYMEYHLFEDPGYLPGEPQIYFATSAAKNCYDNRRWQYKFYTVKTDTAVNAYARAPGAFEAIAMTEYVMEHITWSLDKDPVEIRLRNLNPNYPEVLEVVNTLLSDSEYQKRKQEVQQFNKMNRWKKKGLRVAMMSWPATNLIDFHVLLTVFHGDGTVVVKHGGTEIGQGINTKVIQSVAYTLKIPIDKIKVKGNDVVSNPNSYVTGGSRATQAVCIGAIKCCQLLLDRLNPVRDTLNNPTWEQLVEAAYDQGINLQTSYQVQSNDQQPHRSAGAALVEVELDILTGEHDILRADIVEDVGTSLNPELDIGQIEGAFVMGLGYWTHEHLIYNEKTGELLTDRSWYYHVPLAKDIPIDFRVQLRRNAYNQIGTLGARAVAEPPICLAVTVAFALREAIMSSREDSGFPRTEWFNVDGPFTLEANVLHSKVKLEEFLFQ